VSWVDPQNPFPGADLPTRQANQEIFSLVSWNLFLCVFPERSYFGALPILLLCVKTGPSGLCLQGTLWQDADDGSASRPWNHLGWTKIGGFTQVKGESQGNEAGALYSSSGFFRFIHLQPMAALQTCSDISIGEKVLPWLQTFQLFYVCFTMVFLLALLPPFPAPFGCREASTDGS